MSDNALVSDVDRLVILLEEIAYAETQLQPQGTGHIHTSIGWMKRRVETIREKINASTQ
tara:strand:+ start:171 stop:347 length:177 start_codon:yes stop_codon:yes gene_type:complete